MKEIQQFSIWNKGIEYNAKFILIGLVYDDLEFYARFNWTIFDENTVAVASDMIEMKDADYQNWSGTNLEAYQYVCNSLNIVMI
jgi:hypothetical protein